MFKNLRIRKLLAPNRELRERFRGRKRCFVIGNGPSIKKQDLRPLKNEIVLVCNFFNLHPQCAEISPAFFCFGDPNSFEKSFSSELEINRAEWFKDVSKKAPKCDLIIPVEAAEVARRNNWFAEHKLWLVATRESSCSLGYAGSDLTRPIPGGMGTVAALAIPAAIFMGFQEIYLLGCDCNWWVDNLVKQDLDAECAHFYDKNPFLPRESSLRDFGLETELHCLSLHFKSMRLLREHAESRGAKILNAGAGGILDCFPRVSYEEVIKAAEAGS
jgi:hypothetical protein